MQAICQPENPNAFGFWIPLVIAFPSLTLCCYFAVDNFKRYVKVMFSTAKTARASSPTHKEGGNRQHEKGADSHLSSASSDPATSITKASSNGNRISSSPTAARESQVAPLPATVGTRSTGAQFSLNTFVTSLMHNGKCLWPKTTNQLLATTSLLCWVCMCIDELFVIGHGFSVSVACPQWACSNATPINTPGCPAGSLLRANSVLSSLGLFFYAYTSIHRFASVYSALSPTRHMISRVCSALTVLLLLARLASLTMLSHLEFFPMSNVVVASNDSFISKIAGPVYSSVYTVFYSAIFLIDAVSTAISVHFVLECRAKLRALVPKSTKSTKETITTRAVAALVTMLSSTSTRPVPSEKSSLPSSQHQSSTNGNTVVTHSQSRSSFKEQKHNKMRVFVSRILLLSGTKLFLFVIFALVRFTSLFKNGTSVRAVDAFLLLVLKCFVGAAMAGITNVTRLVALRN